jgi:hypothetical protein
MDIIIYTAELDATLEMLKARGGDLEAPCRRHPGEWHYGTIIDLAVRATGPGTPAPGIYLGGSEEQVRDGTVAMPDGYAINVAKPIENARNYVDTGRHWWLLPELERLCTEIRVAMDAAGLTNARVVGSMETGRGRHARNVDALAGPYMHMVVDGPEGADLAALDAVLVKATDVTNKRLSIRATLSNAIPADQIGEVDLASTWLDEIMPDWND